MKELLKKKSVKTGLLVIVLLVVLGIAGINVQSAQRREEYNGHVEAAEKYLTELDYEQAIAQYNIALEIEPKSEEAMAGLEQTYLAYAKSVADAGDYERAIAILEEGYERTGRASLKEETEAVRSMKEQKEAEEAEKRRLEEARAVEIQQLVEGGNEIFALSLQCIGYMYGDHYISDTQIKDDCRRFADILEEYRSLFPEADWVNWRELEAFYYVLGEFDLCLETRKQLYELSQERQYAPWETTLENQHYDEYGRRYLVKSDLREQKLEFGKDGKLIQKKEVSEGDSGGRYANGHIYTIITTYEYDEEGRLSKKIWDNQRNDGMEQIQMSTYVYHDKGFTCHYESIGGEKTITYDQDYEMDEHGRFEETGERYNYFESR